MSAAAASRPALRCVQLVRSRSNKCRCMSLVCHTTLFRAIKNSCQSWRQIRYAYGQVWRDAPVSPPRLAWAAGVAIDSAPPLQLWSVTQHCEPAACAGSAADNTTRATLTLLRLHCSHAVEPPTPSLPLKHRVEARLMDHSPPVRQQGAEHTQASPHGVWPWLS